MAVVKNENVKRMYPTFYGALYAVVVARAHDDPPWF